MLRIYDETVLHSESELWSYPIIYITCTKLLPSLFLLKSQL